ncbi:MAG: gamma-glutamylcyclotransferase, partial [Oscillatoriales cyanobacterium]
MKVFVYGTLKPGECNYLRYCEGKVVDALPAIA